ncbi:uncharacterized protein IUM83_03087 [Phytophthora cinnamomi]|uniref:uncharacterized protein n=1 Tax=Phytophthora cinnamomi TaxID=4785 RepID=UPI003559C808|nr:hypothetical protein IUM83_03087 [Phytophthora cinnamomi]
MMVSRYSSVVSSTGSNANESTDGLEEPSTAAKSTSSSATSAPHAANQAVRAALLLPAGELPTSGGSNTERRGAEEAAACSSSSLSLSLTARMIIAHVQQILLK